ncbi:MAG TPA: UDP-N-acetylmuramoyl-L-alanine--D-glutamate ligase, partial [Deinococcales bacterium]|nr:UDP-N-acetylmuramoyl-L-alanine--D-glutamate ligase [Deinococcales bacterium]
VRMSAPADSSARVAIVAPGVPADHPHLHALAERGVELTGEVGWVRRTFTGPFVGVTGTAGKGTVTAWLTHVLEHAGVNAVAGGNIDPALSAVATDDAVLVTELSSFQLEYSRNLNPDVAVILNLGEDHLDRHGTVTAYHAAKHHLLEGRSGPSVLVYNQDDPLVNAWRQGQPGAAAGFSLAKPAAAWLDRGVLLLRGRPLLPARELPLPGPHNVANALAVALAAEALGVDHGHISRGLRSFGGLPGRHSPVATIRGITFIDDSIATRPLAVEAALEASPAPLVWLAGGQNKGADIRRFRKLAGERVSLFIGFGEAGPGFCAGLEGIVPVHCRTETDGREALRGALEHAVAHLAAAGHPTGTVLLAPLAASFDQFTDYRE